MQDTIRLNPAGAAGKAALAEIEKEAGTSVKLCYQCGKCTAGCPVAFAMDYPPRQVIRFLQLDLLDEALKAESIWICATCETCSARCPRGVDISSLMDTLRRRALKQGQVTDQKVAAFNQAFLGSVKSFGKVFEAGLMLQYNLSTGQLFKDMELGLPMLKRGKLGFLPEKIKQREDIRKIFARAEKLGGDE